MKSAVLTSNQKIEIKDIKPPIIEKDECLIEIKNVGVCSSDIQRGFENGAYFYPLIMGHEISGEVKETGEGVIDFKEKDRVGVFPLLPCFKCEPCKVRKYVRCRNYSYYGSRRNGGYTEYLSVRSWNLIKMDNNLNYRDIACLEPLSVALHCVRRLRITYEDPKEVLIIGSGFLGLIISKIIKITLPHCNLTIIDRNSFKLNIAKTHSDKIFLIENKKQWKEFLNQRSEKNFDIVIEATGEPSSFVNAIKLTKEGGQCLWMGNITNNLLIDKKTVSSILRKEISILGAWNSDYNPNNVMDDWNEAINLIKKHRINPSKFITHYIKLDEIPEYLNRLYKHKNRITQFNSIKIMVENDNRFL